MSSLDRSVEEAIRSRIREYLDQDDPRVEWIKPSVREHGFLPLYLGWVAVLGIRPDGSFVYLGYEPAPKPARLLEQPFWQRVAIHQGAKKYPELRALLPERPVNAVPCSACRGAGELPGLPPVICGCGGFGWVMPGESMEGNPG